MVSALEYNPEEWEPVELGASGGAILFDPSEWEEYTKPAIMPIEKKEREESPPILKTAGRGLMHGTIGLAESVGTGLQWAGNRISSRPLAGMGETASEYWGEKAEGFAPPENIAGKNVIDNPELLKNASWWVYSVADMVPALAATIIPGMGAAKIAKGIRIAGKTLSLSPEVIARLAKIGQYLPAGLVGGALEGTQTYKQVLKEGAPEEEAARAGELMTLGAGALNALGVSKILAKAGTGFKARIVKTLGAGAWEGLTEGAEEPTEVFAKYISKYLTGAELPDDLKEQLFESLKDAATVAPIAAIVGGGASAIGGGIAKPESKARDTLLDESEEGATAKELLTGEKETIDEQWLADQMAVLAGEESMAAEEAAAEFDDETLEQISETPEEAKLEKPEPIKTPSFDSLEDDDISKRIANIEKSQVAGRMTEKQGENLDLLKQELVDRGITTPEIPQKIEPAPEAKKPWEMTAEEYAGKRPSDIAQNRAFGIKIVKHKDAIKQALSEGKPVPPEVLKDYPELKPKEPILKPKAKESKVRTLRGRIKEMGGINFINYTGELKDLPTAVKYLSKKTGVSIDNAVDQLISDGWLDEGATAASFLEDLRTNAEILKRDRVTKDMAEKAEHELSPQEKRLGKETAWEPEAPPEGKYVQMRAKDLPEGVELTIIDGKSREGWDRYKVTSKDPFSITLTDGEDIELKPLDEVEVLQEELGDRRKEKREDEERRKDVGKRRRVEELSAEEMRKELLVDRLTGIGNGRAYEEANKLPYRAIIDADSLKYTNDTYGHGAGDGLLRRIANALKSTDLAEESYRATEGGDEFILQGHTEEEIDKAVEKAYSYLEQNPIQVVTADKTITIPARFSYGIAKDLKGAEERLKIHKQEREVSGARSRRGEKPAGVLEAVPERIDTEDRGEGIPETEVTPPEKSAEIDAAAAEAATSPENDLPEPTEAQKEAGNYKKAHVSIQGMDITIENPKGSERSGTDKSGKKWSTTMQSHYGYFKRSEGKDGDQIDVFIGSHPESDKAYIVDQVDPGTQKFDEHKTLLGFNSEDEAKKAYLANYEPGWKGLKNITEVSVDKFKQWIGDGKRKKEPFAEEKPDEAEVKPEKAYYYKEFEVEETGERVRLKIDAVEALGKIEDDIFYLKALRDCIA